MSNTATTRNELVTGIDGRGNAEWQVVVSWVRADGRRGFHTHRFDTEGEARNWLKWC